MPPANATATGDVAANFEPKTLNFRDSGGAAQAAGPDGFARHVEISAERSRAASVARYRLPSKSRQNQV